MARGSAKTPSQAPAAASVEPAARLLAWYDRHRRVLPWRALPGVTPDPYAVWLSEIMLQQTTVAAVKAYFLAFLARWPDVGALAAAPEEDVMKQWAGLGYYSRARNLHACAKVVAKEHGCQFPDHEAGLLSLPGIGAYTAAAISAIAFNRRAVVVDGNVERVVTRLFRIEEPLPKAKPLIKDMTASLTPQERPGDFAQAMMDLGATICTPKRLACGLCPLREGCASAGAQDVESFPRKAAKAERPVRLGAAFFVQRADGAVLVRTRPPRGLLGGMTEIPGTDWSEDFDTSSALGLALLPADYRKAMERVEHTFTHFHLQLDVYLGEVAQKCPAPEGCRWVAGDVLDGEALPSLMRKVVAVARRAAPEIGQSGIGQGGARRRSGRMSGRSAA